MQDPRAETIKQLIKLGTMVPDEVELGCHLCYGDFNHKHSIEPKDSDIMVQLANLVSAALERPLNWLHLPVPRNRDDEAYFAPLANLRLPADCEIYLGLIHATDGIEGAKRRISAAECTLQKFGVATECGFGRRPAETVPQLLALHRQVADL